MKIIAVILSIYVLVLSTIPCSDLHTDCDNKEISKKTHTHNHQQDETENCTPLCSCTCCTTGVTTNITYQYAVITKILNTGFAENVKIPTYNSSFISNFYGNIWQPPKI